MAQLSITPHPEFSQRPGETYDAYEKRTEAALQAMEARTEALAPGQVVGAVIRFQVADGYAYYEVMREKPLVLRHINYRDCYQVHSATIRGLRLVDVQDMVAAGQARARLFARRRHVARAATAGQARARLFARSPNQPEND